MPALTLEDEINLMTREAEEMLANGVADNVRASMPI